MWFLPLLVLGAVGLMAASGRSGGRDAAPPTRQLALPPPPPPPPQRPVLSSGAPRSPGPIAVLGEILRVGQTPPPMVILCAIAEAESIGNHDLASDIVQAFVAPMVHAHQKGRGSYGPGVPAAPPPAPAPVAAPNTQVDPLPAAHVGGTMPAPAALPSRLATQDEILAMLHTDPSAFIKAMESGRPPVIDVPIAATPPPPPAPATPEPVPVPAPVPAPEPQHAAVDEAAMTDAVSAQLYQVPGFAGAGVVRVDPAGTEVFEVSWLRGYPIPPLPPQINHWPVRVVVVDALPVPLETAQPTAPETVQALAPGSPLPGVSDEAWRQFVMCLERESPQFESSRHVGQYRQRRERLADLGIHPRAIQGSASAQRAALDVDLADAHDHAVKGGVLAEHLNRSIQVPGHEGLVTITLSGLLGVIQCAGLDGAVGWLERPNDRKRYPHTTQAFLRSNGVF
jgi:hypothetical protein